MVQAIWNGTAVATSKKTVMVEGNHYFPKSDVDAALLRPSSTQTTCPWKGVASYFDVVVNGKVEKDAAWTYPETKPEANSIRGHIAFWRGVRVG